MRGGGAANPSYNPGSPGPADPAAASGNFGPVYETVASNRVQQTLYDPGTMPAAHEARHQQQQHFFKMQQIKNCRQNGPL